jgi:LasA protease
MLYQICIFVFIATTLADQVKDNYQVNDDYFVDNPVSQPNDWENYFSTGALSELKDKFVGYCSRFGVNPSLVLALMDTQSGILTGKSLDVAKPFGELSIETGFFDQMDDVLVKLMNSFYETLEHQQHEFSAEPALKISKTAATQALEDTFVAAGLSPQENLQKLFNTHQSLFHRPLATPQHKASFSAMERKQTQIAMQMPWPEREGNWTSGGAHGNNGRSGPLSSLDIVIGRGQRWGAATPWIYAGHGGIARRVTDCGLRVEHSSGWGTFYYHLSDILVREGQTISRNQRLAKYASDHAQAICDGGSSTGPHLHWNLRFNGREVTMQNRVFSNYEVNVGRDHYDRDCNYFFFRDHNNGARIVCARQPMTAFPPSSTPPPPPPPPPTTRAYERQALGSNSCSTETRQMTREQCEGMARGGFEISGAGWGGVYPESGAPTACYWWSSDRTIYFNNQTSGTRGEATCAPICIRRDAYRSGSANTNSCPSGHRRMTQGECSAMANIGFVGTGRFGYSGSDAGYPLGCYLYAPDNTVYFNTHSTGGSRSSSTPICILT